MALARQLQIADLFAAELERFLRGHLPNSTVERTYVPVVDDDGFEDWIAAATPLKAFIVPTRKVTALETRSEDVGDYSFAVVFVEKCTTAGLPTTAWMDTRVTTVDAAEEFYGDARNAIDTENGQLWAQESEISLVFDPDVMLENHAFWSVWQLTLREIA